MCDCCLTYCDLHGVYLFCLYFLSSQKNICCNQKIHSHVFSLTAARDEKQTSLNRNLIYAWVSSVISLSRAVSHLLGWYKWVFQLVLVVKTLNRVSPFSPSAFLQVVRSFSSLFVLVYPNGSHSVVLDCSRQLFTENELHKPESYWLSTSRQSFYLNRREFIEN